MNSDVTEESSDCAKQADISHDGEVWVSVGSVADITKRKKVVAEIGGHQVLVLADDGEFFALDNICVHRERELVKGVILNGKIVCPGHQWAFALDSGWEAVKQVCQPTHPTRVVEDTVQVRISAAGSETPPPETP
jgi:nitrite reductase (NADH) small subunit